MPGYVISQLEHKMDAPSQSVCLSHRDFEGPKAGHVTPVSPFPPSHPHGTCLPLQLHLSLFFVVPGTYQVFIFQGLPQGMFSLPKPFPHFSSLFQLLPFFPLLIFL